ncbi:hypothetical protein B0T25DRAFT_630768 [Lasiosphaeria hispida]|uniref:C2H2-type domain-containing protein n=1 Tax=Lasiosphaeria hispida TaxID=260671 RepID=A0AAJ0HMV0_9PEZI|nr:hypothetical protein B0T25DRAFT_630768 [Lasiosphaeria hispida]
MSYMSWVPINGIRFYEGFSGIPTFVYNVAAQSLPSNTVVPKTPAAEDAISTVASSIPRELENSDVKATPVQPVEGVNEDARSDAGVSEASFATSVAEAAKLRIPPLPKEAGKGPFECPFCFTMITATNSVSWKRHMYGDLRPCTYHCLWGCDDKFPSVAEWEAHVRATHPDAILDIKLDAMINLSARTLQVEDGITCRLCGETISSLKQYQRHVGRHQEQLSLFALPSIAQMGEDGDNGQRSDESDDDDGHKNAVGISGDDDGSESTAEMGNDEKAKP